MDYGLKWKACIWDLSLRGTEFQRMLVMRITIITVIKKHLMPLASLRRNVWQKQRLSLCCGFSNKTATGFLQGEEMNGLSWDYLSANRIAFVTQTGVTRYLGGKHRQWPFSIYVTLENTQGLLGLMILNNIININITDLLFESPCLGHLK